MKSGCIRGHRSNSYRFERQASVRPVSGVRYMFALVIRSVSTF